MTVHVRTAAYSSHSTITHTSHPHSKLLNPPTSNLTTHHFFTLTPPPLSYPHPTHRGVPTLQQWLHTPQEQPVVWVHHQRLPVLLLLLLLLLLTALTALGVFLRLIIRGRRGVELLRGLMVERGEGGRSGERGTEGGRREGGREGGGREDGERVRRERG